jgi:DNA repair exonuclease SbcCD ATPase subunit
MKLMRLKLHNYKSYADCELNLADISACSIIGGNGAGKSTIIEAIVWALYGSAKTGNKDVVRSGSDRCYVELDMEIDGKLYQVDREYDEGKMALALKVDGKTVAQGSKNLATIMTKAIGASKELLHESVVIPQGQLNSFIRATPSQRRDLVASILGLDKYGAAWEMAKDSLREMTVAVGSRSGTIDTIENQINAMASHTELDASIAGTTAEVTKINDKITELTKKQERMLAEDKSTRDTCTSLDSTIKSLTSKIANAEVQFDAQIDKIESDIRVCDNRVTTIDNLRGMLPSLDLQLKEANDALEVMAQATKDIENTNREIENCRKRIAVIKDSGEVCPLCKTSVNPTMWATVIKNIEDEMRSFMEKLSRIGRPGPNGQPEVITRKISDTKEKIAKLEGQQDSKQILVSQLSGLREQKVQVMEGLRGELGAATQTLKLVSAQLNTEINILGSEISVLSLNRNAMSNKLIGFASAKQSREALENSLKDAKDNLALFKNRLPETEFVAGALSPTGIPLMITDYYMPLVAQRTQELLHMMSDGQLNVKVEVTESGTKKGIELSAGTDTLRPIESLSGGEGTRVSLALRVALSQILQEMSGCHFNCLIVDEPEWLDKNGISQYLSCITKLRDEFEQIFTISHHDELKSVFPQTIQVDKKLEISHAQIL